MGLEKKIRQIGNSQGIIIPKKILDLYNFKIGEKINLCSENDRLVLAKVDVINDKNKKRGKHS